MGDDELLESLRVAGVPCALVSASYRVLLDAALAQLPMGTFQTSVAGDEVHQGKPHPEPYERACRALGVAARRCVVFEDSPNGMLAAAAAGMHCVAVPIPLMASYELPPVSVRLQYLSDLTLDELLARLD